MAGTTFAGLSPVLQACNRRLATQIVDRFEAHKVHAAFGTTKREFLIREIELALNAAAARPAHKGGLPQPLVRS